MEDIPPSYDKIDINILDLLPPYLNTACLVSLCLVSRSYYATFAPHLWGSPASHFVQVADQSSRTTNGINFANLQVSGSQNDMVYVALTRFKRVLRRARLSTRLLCHTLHLPPALSEIYGGPNATWLRDVLDWLPALQSLCVSGLPFFDHDSLVAIDQTKGPSISPDPNDANFSRYPVKLLLAAKEPNVTWIGLSLMIPHLPHLVYLDLSYTSPARHTNVLRSFDALQHLQILKLRGIGLKDSELETLANVIRLRVRLLDIADNQLTDRAIRSLLQACVWLPSSQAHGRNRPPESFSRRDFESWPVGIPPPPDALSLDTIRTVGLDEALLTQLTNPLTGRLALEDLPHGGITHLYISGNTGVTIEGVRSILDVGRLHVLDAGDIGTISTTELQSLVARLSMGNSKEVARARSITTANMNLRGIISRHRSRPNNVRSNEASQTVEDQQGDFEDIITLPGAEKLIPVLREKASANLTHLRVEHAVVTANLDIGRELKEKEKKVANLVELPDEAARAIEMGTEGHHTYEASGSTTFATEMPVNNAIFEMDATPAPPRAELPGDIIHFAISPPVSEVVSSPVEEKQEPVRGEGAMAPEVVLPAKGIDLEYNSMDDVILDATGSGVRRQDTSSTHSSVSPLTAGGPNRAKNEDIDAGATPILGQAAPLNATPRLLAFGDSSFKSNDHAEIARLTSIRPKKPATRLHPSFLPNLSTLILTNLPAQVPTASVSVIGNLKDFIAACANETRIAVLKATTDYSLRPGKARQEAERYQARKLFALRTIVLEVSPEPELTEQRGWKHTRQRMNAVKSSTGDRDSEALWAASENDFSFFGEDGEEAAECGIYEQEPEKYYPTIQFSEEKVFVSNGGPSDITAQPYSPAMPSTPIRAGALSPTNFGTPSTPIARNGTVLQSPRNLPLGRNHRPGNDFRGSSTVIHPGHSRHGSASSQITEMPGTIPTPSSAQIPRSQSSAPPAKVTPAPRLDVVAELAKWRRERKVAFENEVLRRRRTNTSSPNAERLADIEIYMEGYWTGEVKVVRNAKKASSGKLERRGNVDIYGNYFEGGYLYP